MSKLFQKQRKEIFDVLNSPTSLKTCQTSKINRLEGTFGSVGAQCGHQMKPNERLGRVPKKNAV